LAVSLKKLVYTLLAVAFTLATWSCAAQVHDSAQAAAPKDTIHQKIPIVGSVFRDTIPPTNKAGKFQPNPKKAGLYSAIVPGLGQLYNREYWKIPVVYVGIGIAGYFFLNNLNNYQSYRLAYIGRINNPYPTDKYVNIYTTDQLNQLQNDYSKYLDMTALFSGIGYMLQVLDAITSAHLKNFDISRDISMHMKPVVIPIGTNVGLGMALVVKLK